MITTCINFRSEKRTLPEINATIILGSLTLISLHRGGSRFPETGAPVYYLASFPQNCNPSMLQYWKPTKISNNRFSALMQELAHLVCKSWIRHCIRSSLCLFISREEKFTMLSLQTRWWFEDNNRQWAERTVQGNAVRQWRHLHRQWSTLRHTSLCMRNTHFWRVVNLSQLEVEFGIQTIFLQWLVPLLLARLESAYSLTWGAHEIWGQGGGEPLVLLW